MTSRVDVVVVGAGVAGLAAALSASREGASVQVLDGGAGASALAGGAWDLPSPAGPFSAPRTPERALDALARRDPAHPLARLPRASTLAALRAGHDALFEALAIYRPLAAHADGCLVASELGLLRRAASAQRSVLDLAPLPRARVAVAGMCALRSFDAAFVAASLNEQATRAGDARRFASVDVELFRRAGDTSLLPHESASLLDQPDTRRLAIRALERALGGASFDAVLLPPILGLESDRFVPELEAALGVPCGEALGSLACAQSLRLSRRIAAALDDASIPREEARAERVVEDGEGIALRLAGGATLRAGAIVLATGKHVGGGVVSASHDVREPLFDLPIWSRGRPLPLASSVRGRDPVGLYGDDPFAPGPGFALGVGYDTELRALDAHGEPVSRALFACGALLDGASDGDGLGAAALTGWIAGASAARAARS